MTLFTSTIMKQKSVLLQLRSSSLNGNIHRKLSKWLPFTVEKNSYLFSLAAANQNFLISCQVLDSYFYHSYVCTNSGSSESLPIKIVPPIVYYRNSATKVACNHKVFTQRSFQTTSFPERLTSLLIYSYAAVNFSSLLINVSTIFAIM